MWVSRAAALEFPFLITDFREFAQLPYHIEWWLLQSPAMRVLPLVLCDAKNSLASLPHVA